MIIKTMCCYGFQCDLCDAGCAGHAVRPVIAEQVLYDKFLCRKFYLLVCIRNFDNFYCDKYTWASMLAFQQVYLSQYKNCQSTNFARLYGSTKKTCQNNLSTCMQLVSDLLL